MIALIILLLITLIVVPYLSYEYGQPLTSKQAEISTIVAEIALAQALLVFTVSVSSGNYGQIDKLWGIMPVVYVLTMASLSELNSRSVLMAVLVTIWGA